MWEFAAVIIGCKICRSAKLAESGRYGDSNSGIDLAQLGDYFLWIDECVSPAVALAKLGGSQKSAIKSQKSAENGRKGCRPRKS